LSHEIKLLLFDLGGVLVTWNGVKGLQEYSGGKMTMEEARLFWMTSEWVRKFERGWCTASEFVSGVLTELDFHISEEQIIEGFHRWDKGPMPGAFEFLTELRSHYKLACLSNNNEFHWDRLKKKYRAESFFDKCYLSHEIGMIKPDPEIYDFVIKDLGISPSEILFFDDNPECVEAAKEAGLSTCLTKGIEEVKTCLKKKNLWPPELV